MKTGLSLKAVLAAILAAALWMPFQAYAETPYKGYTWNTLGEDVASINGYVYQNSIDALDTKAGGFKNPEDLFIREDDTMYVVDTGNSRILRMDRSGKLLRTIGDASGPGKLNEPKGVYVTDDGTIYVADTKNQRIAIFDPNGRFKKELTKPSNPLLGADFSYSPSKLVVDKRGYLYVISDGNTQGLLQIDPNGDFKGFYGANHIGFSWTRLLVKLLATKEQQSQLATVKPAEFSDVNSDEEGFMYTLTLGEEFNQLKRLSPVGVDTLNAVPHRYGDKYSDGPFEVASFVGIDVDDQGFITALDLQSSKVFQYDKLGNLLFTFGGAGDQNGLFVTPSAVAQTSDGIVYVLDKGRNRIDCFRTTPFADLVHQASTLYVDGRYEEAEDLWKDVLKQNANYDMAYLAIGKSLFKAERYKEAMEYFKLARSKADYSAAYKEYRKEFIREHFGLFFTGAILLFIALRWGLPWLYRAAKSQWNAKKADRPQALEGEIG